MSDDGPPTWSSSTELSTRSTPPGSWARAVGVKEGVVVAVGTEDDVRPLVDAGTEVVDLAGGCCCPGSRTHMCIRHPADST